ncbi:restriction endonuclease subunit S [Pantoea vagans]|uniref:restriction endonuclease subunit S n=1 Tax=Pantoea vagans TaxID=470934 RepID=UPI0023B1D579|nr:restriction endonuclease subunit S [Pantoea vagans]MDE8555829.1 restriction endonuclease subunit S [Pantoea vagans]MDE8575879.1 restriction endonuclease subunit S [Pantoea vagans]
MDAKQFLAEFGHVAHAPEGIARLRELIYQLAVTGRLTSQDENDGGAGDVLNNVAHIRQQLIAGKKYKRSPKLESSKIVPPAIDLPFNWRWSRLLDLGEINPRNQAGETAMATFVPMAGVSEKHSKEISGEIKSWSKINKGYTHFANGDVLLAKITPCFENGKAAVVSGLEHDIGSGSTEFHVFRSISQFIHPGYVYLFLRSPLFRAKGEASMTGTAGQKRLPTDYFALCAMPLPPTAEQYRIVAKVDDLMALCDKLETQQQARRKLQNALRQSILQAVASATSPHELQTNWTRLADNFGRLFHSPEDVGQIKELILDLAIQGRLVDRQLDDEPVEALINRSLEAKGVRLASGEMKNKKPSATDIVDVEINIPPHWKRASLEELFQFIDYRGKTPAKTSSGAVLITAKNVRPGFIASEPVEFLSESSYHEWMTRGFPRIGDLLITTEAPLGNVARIDEQPNFALAQRVIDLQPFADLNTKCAMYFMMSPLFQLLLKENSTGMTAKGIKAGKLKQLLLPLPPKEEQQRIVQRVEELLYICSVQSSQLESAIKQSTRFAVAAVSSITGIAIEQEEEPMKAPQTELIAPLRLGTAPDIKAQAPLATILARHHGEMSAKDLWQRFGGEIDAFYAQLKIEVAHGWIKEPTPAEVREKPASMVSA